MQVFDGLGSFRSVERSVGANGVSDICDQAIKGAWGMSWHQKTLKGVEDCDKPGGIVKQVLIPGSLNWCALNP